MDDALKIARENRGKFADLGSMFQAGVKVEGELEGIKTETRYQVQVYETGQLVIRRHLPNTHSDKIAHYDGDPKVQGFYKELAQR